MKFLFKTLVFIPLILIILELSYLTYVKTSLVISPQSDDNQYLTSLTQALRLSRLNYQQITIFDHRKEVEFLVSTPEQPAFKVILSTNQSPFIKVGALQKLIKIANIEDRDIIYVDFSSIRPYATL